MVATGIRQRRTRVAPTGNGDGRGGEDGDIRAEALSVVGGGASGQEHVA